MPETGIQYFVKIRKALLITQKNSYDLRDIIQFLFYYTSIDNYHMLMNILITDAQDALANWEVNLNDKLEFIIEDMDGKIFKRTLYLLEVEPDMNPITPNDNIRMLSFVFSSQMLITNLKTTISKKFKMPKNSLYSFIYGNYLSDNDIGFKNECSDNGIIELWSHYWHPYDILDFLLSQTYDSFYDYVLFDDGTKERLVSLSHLAQQPRKYTFSSEFKEIKKATSSLNIHESKLINNMSILKLNEQNGLGNIFYKYCRPLYGHKRVNISPRKVSSRQQLIDNDVTNLYPKKCCGNFRGGAILSHYDCKALQQKVGEKSFWNWHYLQTEMKGLITRKPGEVAWVKMPILAGSLSLNPRYDGRWLIHTIKTSISKNGECNQVIKLAKNDYFMSETYNDTELSIKTWKE